MCFFRTNQVTKTEDPSNETVKVSIESLGHTMKELNSEICENRIKTATAWKNVMKGPPPAPMCKGHSEKCVLRTVKKKGPNLGRQFWCCPKGEGRTNDPNARCDFFKWLK